MARQIRVRGVAVCLADEECRRDFLERGVEARVCAVASRQSSVLNDGDGGELEARLGEVRGVLERKPDSDLGVEGWRVYAVDPESVEFWQGVDSRLHKRVRYVRVGEGEGDEGEGWKKEMLWP